VVLAYSRDMTHRFRGFGYGQVKVCKVFILKSNKRDTSHNNNVSHNVSHCPDKEEQM
jgi:hypothetical protein